MTEVSPSPDLTAGLKTEIAALQAQIVRLQVLQGHDPSEFDRVVEAAVRCFGDGDDLSLVWRWLCRPVLRLGERLPLELVLEGREDEIVTLLGQMEHGVYI